VLRSENVLEKGSIIVESMVRLNKKTEVVQMTNKALKIVHLATIIVEEVKREEFDNERLEELIKEFEETLKMA